jgi:hypothetical protein
MIHPWDCRSHNGGQIALSMDATNRILRRASACCTTEGGRKPDRRTRAASCLGSGRRSRVLSKVAIDTFPVTAFARFIGSGLCAVELRCRSSRPGRHTWMQAAIFASVSRVRHKASSNTGLSWSDCSDESWWPGKQFITRTGSGRTIARKTWNCGSASTLAANGLRTLSRSLKRFLRDTKTSCQRSSPNHLHLGAQLLAAVLAAKEAA